MCFISGNNMERRNTVNLYKLMLAAKLRKSYNKMGGSAHPTGLVKDKVMF
jgi:hypothetical protein